MESHAPGPDTTSESFIQAARREQILRSAVALISELGVERASTVRIARHAGVSRGVVSYHFGSREELIDRVVEEVYRLAQGEVGPPVATASTPREALLAFIEGSIDFYARHPAHMAALVEVFAADRHSSDRSRAGRAEHRRETADLSALLTEGQQRGEFRSFDVEVMAATIRAALDAALLHITSGGAVEVLRAELRRTFDAATRKENR